MTNVHNACGSENRAGNLHQRDEWRSRSSSEEGTEKATDGIKDESDGKMEGKVDAACGACRRKTERTVEINGRHRSPSK